MKTKSHPLFRPALILMSFLAVLFTFSLQGCASITRDLTMSCSEQYRSCEDIPPFPERFLRNPYF